MANKLLTPDVIAKQALATLHETLVMAKLVHVDYTQEFSGQKVGDTINIRKPATFVAKDFNRANGIEIQDGREDSIPMKLDKFKDVSFSATTEELALDIEDFDEQLLTPAMNAIALAVDTELLGLRKDFTQVAGLGTEFPFNKPEVLLEAGALLDVNKVPVEDRFAVVGPMTKATWLNTPLLKQANTSGTTEALRRASLGNDLFGFNTFYTNNIAFPSAPATGQPTTETDWAFHKSAIAFASAPQSIPAGANGYVATHQGVSVRVIMDYDMNKKEQVISVDTLFGVKTLDPNRGVLMYGGVAA